MGNANISQLWSAAREAVWLLQERVTHQEHRSIAALLVALVWSGGNWSDIKGFWQEKWAMEKTTTFYCMVIGFYNLCFLYILIKRFILRYTGLFFTYLISILFIFFPEQ